MRLYRDRIARSYGAVSPHTHVRMHQEHLQMPTTCSITTWSLWHHQPCPTRPTTKTLAWQCPQNPSPPATPALAGSHPHDGHRDWGGMCSRVTLHAHTNPVCVQAAVNQRAGGAGHQFIRIQRGWLPQAQAAIATRKQGRRHVVRRAGRRIHIANRAAHRAAPTARASVRRPGAPSIPVLCTYARCCVACCGCTFMCFYISHMRRIGDKAIGATCNSFSPSTYVLALAPALATMHQQHMTITGFAGRGRQRHQAHAAGRPGHLSRRVPKGLVA